MYNKAMAERIARQKRVREPDFVHVVIAANDTSWKVFSYPRKPR